MKKVLLLLALVCSVLLSYAQDFGAPINRDWQRYADDTSLTYLQITHICDSLFRLAGFANPADTVEDTTNQEEEPHIDGSAYREYCLWQSFWYSRCDSNGRLHDITADAVAMLNEQQKTTAPH